MRADRVLELLRDGSREALDEAEKILGKKITKCPPCIPPWPPKPLPDRPKVLKVVTKNECNHFPGSDAHGRFQSVRIGMTRERLIAAGVLPRDILKWTKEGSIVMEER